MLLQTCKSEILQKHEGLLFDNFSELYQIMRKDVHIKEEVYKKMVFLADTNYTRKEVDKPDSIRQKGRQHAKILSRKFQISLCAKKERDASMVITCKINKDKIVSYGIHKRNNAATLKFFPKSEQERNYKYLPIECFKKLNVKELKAFIHVWLFDYAVIPSRQLAKIPKNKGKVEDAVARENNLINATFHNRELPIILYQPELDDRGFIIMVEDKDLVKDDNANGVLEDVEDVEDVEDDVEEEPA